MTHTELVISFGDLQPVTFNTVLQDGLLITELPDRIKLYFGGADPAYLAKQLERFRNRGILITAKRNHDPRRRLRGALTSLTADTAEITLGKYPVGLEIDAPEEPGDTLPPAGDSSFVNSLLAQLDAQRARIQTLESDATKAQPETPVAKPKK